MYQAFTNPFLSIRVLIIREVWGTEIAREWKWCQAKHTAPVESIDQVFAPRLVDNREDGE